MARIIGAFFLLLLPVVMLGNPCALASDLLVANFNQHNVLRYDADTGEYLGIFNGYTTHQPQGVFVHGDRVYVTTGNMYNIVVLDAASGAKVLDFESDPQSPCYGVDVIVGPDEKIYTSCHDIHGTEDRVICNDPTDGRKLGEYVAPGTAPISFIEGLAFGPDGKLYVASSHSVVRFNGPNDPAPTVFNVRSIGLSGPNRLTFGPDGKLYVTGKFSNNVARIDPDDGSVSMFISGYISPLWLAGGLAFGPDGNLYVASINTDEVLRYNGATGEFVGAFLTQGLGGLDAPFGIAFNPPATIACRDMDGDGFGVLGSVACPGGSTPDCIDSDSSVHPGAAEICDGKDNDCDGVVPPEEVDADGDGYRVCQNDCDDVNASINPVMVELPGNFVDENCDGDLGDCYPCLTWRNHGQYVRCVAHAVELLVTDGGIAPESGDALVSNAAASEVGKKDFIPGQCQAH